jgi:acyl-lipid omega-6 desaturase (Delta-12 desaturase)
MGENDSISEPNQQLNKHISKFIRPNNTRAFLALGVSLLVEAVAIFLILTNVYLLGWTIHCLNMVRIFVQFHDMAHFSYFESIWLNKLVGHIVGVYVQYPFQMWRDGHNHHHKHFGNLDKVDLSQTIVFTKKDYEGYSTPRKLFVRFFREPVVFFLFTVQYLWFAGVIYTSIKKYGLFSISIFEKFLSVLVFYIYWIYDMPVLELYLSLHMAQAFGTSLFHLQHSVNAPYREHKEKWDFSRAALEGSTFLDVPYLLRIFTNGIEYHHIHHLNTNVASYAIQECH